MSDDSGRSGERSLSSPGQGGSAPRLNADALLALPPGWDSYSGKPISPEAVSTANALHAVPLSDGGIQLELHAGGMDVEIEIHPDGRLASVWFEDAGC